MPITLKTGKIKVKKENGTYTNLDGISEGDTMAKVVETVEDWLDDNISGGEGVAVDTTLQISGAAADSKTVGDELSELNNALNDQQEDILDLEKNKAQTIKDTIIGSLVRFPDGEDNVPVEQFVVNYNPVSNGSGNPSPNNIRNVPGCSSCEIIHNENTIEIEFPVSAGIVCGGSLNVLTGLLTVTHKKIVVDGTTDGHKITYASNGTFSIPIEDGSLFGRTTAGWVNDSSAAEYKFSCNSFRYSYSDTNDYVIRVYVGTTGGPVGRFVFPSSENISTAANANTYFADKYSNNEAVYICYPLATVETYQLTPVEINTILGNNAFTVNCGVMSIVYLAETGRYINKNITNKTLPVKLKVCSYNVHAYSKPTPADPTHDTAVIQAMKVFLNDENFDIMGLQENLLTFTGLEENVDEVLYKPLFQSILSVDVDVSLKSKYKMKNKGTGIFSYTSSQTIPNYCYGTITLSGQDIFVMCVHLISSDLAGRESQYAELISMLNQHDYYIVFGDFNAGTQSGGIGHEQDEYDILINNGCHVANGGYLGLIYTNTGYARALDNIVTSPNIIIGKTYVPDVGNDLYSDHLPIISELLILPKEEPES